MLERSLPHVTCPRCGNDRQAYVFTDEALAAILAVVHEEADIFPFVGDTTITVLRKIAEELRARRAMRLGEPR